MVIHPSSAHLLETTARVGWVFGLGCWGALVAYRRGDRLGRLWAAQVIGAGVTWTGYLLLSALQLARERDEIYYWMRFLLAASAGIGAWDLAGRATAWLRLQLSPAAKAAAIGALALPWSLPYWWNPAVMDSYFAGSLAALPEPIRASTGFLRERTEARAVIAGDPDFARYGAALGARRALLGDSLHMPPDWADRSEVQRLLVSGRDPEAVLAASARYGVRYLVVTPSFLRDHFPGESLAKLRELRHLQAVFFTGDPSGEFIAIFRVGRPT
jgi:hypothetical protein